MRGLVLRVFTPAKAVLHGEPAQHIAPGEAFRDTDRQEWIALGDGERDRETGTWVVECVYIWSVPRWKRLLWFRLSPGASRPFTSFLVWWLLK